MDRKPDSPTASVGDDSADHKIPYIVDAESQLDTSETAYVIDHHAERSLCRKFDFRLLPVLAVMYLFNALDKGNLGNAKSAKPGIEETLHFKSNQYNIILSVFYVPYVLFAPPIVSTGFSQEFLIIKLTRRKGMLGKKYGPNRVLPMMMFSFGSMTVLTVAATNFGGMMALRWFLGI